MSRAEASEVSSSVALQSYAGSSLRVLQPSMWRNTHELRDGETCLGILRLTSILGSEAQFECGQGSWTIRQSGVWKPKLTIRESTLDDPIVEIPVSFLKKTITFVLPERDHEALRLGRNFWASQFTLTGRMGRELVRLDMKRFSLSSASVTIGQKAASYRELPWLLFLVWYTSIATRRSHSHAHVS